jgi:hypothetical protein
MTRGTNIFAFFNSHLLLLSCLFFPPSEDLHFLSFFLFQSNGLHFSSMKKAVHLNFFSLGQFFCFYTWEFIWTKSDKIYEFKSEFSNKITSLCLIREKERRDNRGISTPDNFRDFSLLLFLPYRDGNKCRFTLNRDNVFLDISLVTFAHIA